VVRCLKFGPLWQCALPNRGVRSAADAVLFVAIWHQKHIRVKSNNGLVTNEIEETDTFKGGGSRFRGLAHVPDRSARVPSSAQHFCHVNIRCLRLGSQDVHQFRFQSRSKTFWNRWLKQYAIIIRSRLITIHNLIHYHFSTFSECCKHSIWRLDTNVINKKLWCVSHFFT